MSDFGIFGNVTKRTCSDVSLRGFFFLSPQKASHSPPTGRETIYSLWRWNFIPSWVVNWATCSRWWSTSWTFGSRCNVKNKSRRIMLPKELRKHFYQRGWLDGCHPDTAGLPHGCRTEGVLSLTIDKKSQALATFKQDLVSWFIWTQASLQSWSGDHLCHEWALRQISLNILLYLISSLLFVNVNSGGHALYCE